MATDNPILERMVPEMIENMIQIVVDHKLERKNYSTVNSVLPNKEKSRSSFDSVIFCVMEKRSLMTSESSHFMRILRKCLTVLNFLMRVPSR